MKKYYYLFKASLGKNIKELIRYKFNTLSWIIIFYVMFMAMFLGVKSFGSYLGATPIAIGDTLEGFIAGFFLWTVLAMAYSDTAYSIIQDANIGTLEQLNMSGISLANILTVRSLTNILFNLVLSIALLFLIMYTTGYWVDVKVISILIPMFIGIFSILGIGLICGGLALIFKKVKSLLEVIQYFLVGLIIINPESEILYSIIPFKPASYNIFRTMLEGVSFTECSLANYGIMILNSLVYFVIGLLVFNKCVKIAKSRGLLGQY